MAEYLYKQGHEIYIIDNNSTYEPLLEFYDNCPYNIIRLKDNLGYRAPWLINVIDYSDYYVVTDPDLGIDHIPSDWDKYCIEGLKKYKNKKDGMGNDIIKCGFSLDSSKIPKANPAYDLDKDSHNIIWSSNNNDGYISYGIDTTFAVYRPGTNYHIPAGIRTDYPYVAYHYPWHIVLEKTEDNALEILMDDELCNYILTSRGRSDGSDNYGYSYSSYRMLDMAKKYKERNGKI